MRSLLLAILLLPIPLNAETIYSADWQSLSTSTSLDATPPTGTSEGNWRIESQTGSGTATIETNAGWSSKAARLLNSSKWTNVYNDQVTCGNCYSQTRVDGSRAWIGTRYAGGVLSGWNPTSGYWLDLNAGTNELRLLEGGVGGVFALQTESFTVTEQNDYNMKLEVIGSTINGYIDGSLEITATDSTFSTGGIGMVALGTVDYDDLLVDDLQDTGGGDEPHWRKLKLFNLFVWVLEAVATPLYAATDKNTYRRAIGIKKRFKLHVKRIRKLQFDISEGKVTRTLTPTPEPVASLTATVTPTPVVSKKKGLMR